MANGEGFKMAIVLIVSFMLMAIASFALIYMGRVDISTLKEIYIGLGTLAAMFGIPGIIASWVTTRTA